MKFCLLPFLTVLYSFECSLETISMPEKNGFSLVDRICVEVEGEPSILQSDIEKRKAQKPISFQKAKEELIRETLVWVIAKKQLKFDTNQIKKAALEHLKRVKEENNFTNEKLAELLMEPPYLTTPKRFLREIETSMVLKQYHTISGQQIAISDVEVNEYIKKARLGLSDDFDIVYIKILPSDKNSNKKSLFSIASNIKSKISSSISVDDLKRIFEKEKNISIYGPLSYEKGTLKHVYEENLASSRGKLVTDPFHDQEENSVVIMWKIKSLPKVFDETVLEKVRKELYERAVAQKYQVATDEMMNSSIVVDKDCKER